MNITWAIIHFSIFKIQALSTSSTLKIPNETKYIYCFQVLVLYLTIFCYMFTQLHSEGKYCTFTLLHLTTYYGTDLCKYLEPDMKRYIYLNVFIAYMQYIMLDSRDPDILLSATIFDIFLQRTIGAACAKHIQAGGRFFDMTLLRIIEKPFSKFSGWKSQD